MLITKEKYAVTGAVLQVGNNKWLDMEGVTLASDKVSEAACFLGFCNFRRFTGRALFFLAKYILIQTAAFYIAHSFVKIILSYKTRLCLGPTERT